MLVKGNLHFVMWLGKGDPLILRWRRSKAISGGVDLASVCLCYGIESDVSQRRGMIAWDAKQTNEACMPFNKSSWRLDVGSTEVAIFTPTNIILEAFMA